MGKRMMNSILDTAAFTGFFWCVLTLLAALAQAGGVAPYVATHIGDGRDSYTLSRNPAFADFHREPGTLYVGEQVPQAYQDVEQPQVDPETGETNLVTVSVAVDHALCKWIVGEPAPIARTQAELDDYTAMVDVKAAAAQAAQIEALLSRLVDENDPSQGTAREQIIKIEGVVEWFIQAGAGITRPVKVAPTVQLLNTFIEHLEAAEMWAVASKAQRYATTLVAGISGFEKQGITAEQINAAWLYMGSPLPQQQ